MKKTFAPLLLCVSAFVAEAHTPYFVPTSFEPVFDGQVTLDASFAEKFFVPEAAFNNGDFFVVGPDGKSVEPDTHMELNTRTIVEHQLAKPGTYRFATGARYGAVFRIYELDGKTMSTRDPEEVLPEGAKVLNHFQSVSWSESYVSKDGPTDTVLKARGEGLEILPLSHPNDLFAGDAFRFQVLFEGKPMTDYETEFHWGKDQFSEGEKTVVTTDASGEGLFTPEAQGVYLMYVRHRAPAPTGAPAPTYSHTTTLSLEAY